jgi:hypothetical protein
MAFTIASPAPPVLQSDTFEIQRQKINNLYNAIANGGNGGGIKQWTWLAQPKIIWIGNAAGYDASTTFGVLRGALNAAATGFSGQTGLGNFILASNVYNWTAGYFAPIDSGFLNLTTTLQGVTPAAVELYYLGRDDTDNWNGQATYVQNSSSTIIKMSLENAGGIIARNANLSTPDGTIRIYRYGDADLYGSVIAVTGYYA